ncbi:uncharacterized protein VDAG_06832 [Verticillium dahliae VdLs.17]|uniref:Uncharacterized protein n=2 Tax=Verticillium dahliae TaxID=27337 RepID=G2X9K0_VERDV|nr:uncharacterized protein VDAG_06832 [Verticillium dahliae VdLs.17]EGY15668.1 hypothetical protein VDAG_06832 [Verticillium dahliae VdLs.17]KAH6697674.1 hypothetical protein EV126DRAFT_57198 [Verticillium dahliae]
MNNPSLPGQMPQGGSGQQQPPAMTNLQGYFQSQQYTTPMGPIQGPVINTQPIPTNNSMFALPPRPPLNSSTSSNRVLVVLAFPTPSAAARFRGSGPMSLQYPGYFHWINLPQNPGTVLHSHAAWASCPKVVILMAEDDYQNFKYFCTGLASSGPVPWSLEPHIIKYLRVHGHDEVTLVDRFSQLCLFGADDDLTATEHLWWPGELVGAASQGFRWSMMPPNNRRNRPGQDYSACGEYRLSRVELRACRQNMMEAPGCHAVQHYDRSWGTGMNPNEPPSPMDLFLRSMDRVSLPAQNEPQSNASTPMTLVNDFGTGSTVSPAGGEYVAESQDYFTSDEQLLQAPMPSEPYANSGPQMGSIWDQLLVPPTGNPQETQYSVDPRLLQTYNEPASNDEEIIPFPGAAL